MCRVPSCGRKRTTGLTMPFGEQARNEPGPVRHFLWVIEEENEEEEEDDGELLRTGDGARTRRRDAGAPRARGDA
jgi:hypothetical protein